jgi:hypothetical protein
MQKTPIFSAIILLNFLAASDVLGQIVLLEKNFEDGDPASNPFIAITTPGTPTGNSSLRVGSATLDLPLNNPNPALGVGRGFDQSATLPAGITELTLSFDRAVAQPQTGNPEFIRVILFFHDGINDVGPNGGRFELRGNMDNQSHQFWQNTSTTFDIQPYLDAGATRIRAFELGYVAENLPTGTGAGGFSITGYIDNIRVTYIPEPTTAILVAEGGLLMLLWRR